MPDREHDAGLTDGPPRAAVFAALGVAVVAVVGVLGFAAWHRTGPGDEPVVIPGAPAPQADSADCRKLLSALPEQLGDYPRATPAEPAPTGTAAWRVPNNEQPAVLRCGLDTPVDFVVGAPVQVVNGVQWFVIADQSRITWFAVDRPVGLALTLPADTGATPVQQMSDLVAANLPATKPRPGPP